MHKFFLPFFVLTIFLLASPQAKAGITIGGVVPEPITLTSPNGGESWEEGSTHAITWTSTHPDIVVVSLFYSTDGGSTFSHTIITDETDDGSLTWAIPSLSSTTVRVQIVGKDSGGNTVGSDNSNADFAITTPTGTTTTTSTPQPTPTPSPTATPAVPTTTSPEPTPEISPSPSIEPTPNPEVSPSPTTDPLSPSPSSSFEPTPEPVPGIIPTITKAIGTAVGKTVEEIVSVVDQALTTPEGRDATATTVAVATASTPVVAGLATALLNGNSPIAALRYVFFFWRPRPRKNWGKVYDDTNHLPLVGVDVGLVPEELRGTIQKTVTDPNGGYSFYLQEAGKYKVGVTAAGFASYTSDPEHVKEALPEKERIIYLAHDKKGYHEVHTRKAVFMTALAKWLNLLSPLFVVIGLSFSIYNIVVFQDMLSVAILAIYVLLGVNQYLVFSRVHFNGTVLNNKGQILAGAVVRAFHITPTDKVFISATLSDKEGNYSFRLKPGTYAFTISKDTYNTFTSQVLTLDKQKGGRVTTTLEPFSYLGNSYGE